MTRQIVFAMVALAICTTAQAGPFSRRYVSRSSETVCTTDGCGGSTTATTHSVVRGSTTTAAGVAAIQAEQCRLGHHGGNVGYEGVGSGPTPEAALANCCNNGGRVIDQGVARGRDGWWYACRRYSR